MGVCKICNKESEFISSFLGLCRECILIKKDAKKISLEAHLTNCVTSWVCAASGKGYPKYSYSKGPEYDFCSLAVFYGACNFNCLFCQNWHFRENLRSLTPIIPTISSR